MWSFDAQRCYRRVEGRSQHGSIRPDDYVVIQAPRRRNVPRAQEKAFTFHGVSRLLMWLASPDQAKKDVAVKQFAEQRTVARF